MNKLALSIVVVAVSVPLLVNMLAEHIEELDVNGPVYDLQPLVTPKLSGGALKMLVKVVGTWPFSALLASKIYKDSGFHKIRQLARTLHVSPTLLPAKLPSNDVKSEAEKYASELDLEKLIDSESLSKKDGKSFHYWTIEDYSNAYKSGKVTPLDVAKSFLAEEKELENSKDAFRAFIAIDEASVLEQAKASTERYKSGKPLSVLDGVLVAVKDEVDVKGYTTSVGTSILKNAPKAAKDAFVVAQLRDKGAIISGKTNMQELGLGVNGLNLHWGIPRNPYNISYHTGGSSSGSAAAVGSGLVPIAVGCDGGGSVRLPAAFCGAVGLKASYGRVSEEGAFPLTISLGFIGPIAATVKDAAIMYAATAGPNPHDQNSLIQPAVHLHDFQNTNIVKGLKIGIFTPWFNDADPEIVKACRAVVDKLVAQGAIVKEVTIPHLAAITKSHALTIVSEIAAGIDKHFSKTPHMLGDDVHSNLLFAHAFHSLDYVSAQKVRTYALEIFDKIFSEVDIMVTPATGLLPPKIEEAALNGDMVVDTGALSSIMKFVAIFNFVGNPAITLPVAYTDNNLPIAVQIVGRNWEEHVILSVANLIESWVEKQKPQLHVSLLKN